MAPVAMRANTCEGCLMGKATARRRGVHCGAAPRAPRVAQTVARKVQVKPEQDFANTPNRRYLFPTGDIFPLGPLLYRKTISKQLIKGVMWSFEQPQGLAFSNVQVNVRMTVTKLSDGSLLVYNPIAPTNECLDLVAELDADIKYIVLGSAAYEHKVFVGPFSRRFPKAEVHVAPQQWSFPLNLPVQFFGIFPTGTIQEGDPSAPWAADFDSKVFAPPPFALVGLYSEVAMYHKPTKTLLLTDACIQLPRKPPECLSPATLLDNAKNGFVIRAADAQYAQGDTSSHIYDGRPVPDTPGNRLLGWQRICLLVCFFGPSSLYDPDASFNKYAGRPIVFPVVGSLVYSRCGKYVRKWIEGMAADWDFKQIVPAHFAAPISCTGKELIAAFQRSTDVYEPEVSDKGATERGSGDTAGGLATSNTPGGFLQRLLMSRLAGSKPGESVLDEADLQALEGLNKILEATKAVKVRPQGPLIRDGSLSKSKSER